MLKSSPHKLLALVVLIVMAHRTPADAQVNVLTYHNDLQRTGQNLNEMTLTLANVNQTTFGKLFSYAVDGHVYAQPLLVANVAIAGKGTHNVLLVATQHDSVYAFDADSNTGANSTPLWSVNLGPSAATPNTTAGDDFGNRYGAYHDINPEIGITSTPVIDPASGTVYVNAFTHDGFGIYHHTLHALSLADGSEKFGGPKQVTATVAGAGTGSVGGVQTFDPRQELQRPGLTLVNGKVFIAYSGIADTNPYHGWVIGFNASTLQQLSGYVFNTTPNSTTAAFGSNAGEGGIWMGGDGLAVDSGNNLYFEVGNGIFDGVTEFGDSFVKLGTGGSLAVADYFTPFNQAALATADTDIGSGGLMLLPDQPGALPHLLVGAGKEGKIYLINRDQMTAGNNHYDSVNNIDHVVQSVAGQIGGSFDTPAYFNGRIYYAANGDRLKAFTISNGGVPANPALLSTTPNSTGARSYTFPGSSPSISASGTGNGIVWVTQMGSPAVLTASAAGNVTAEIYASDQAGARDQLPAGVKFTLPTVANGKVYVGGQYAVSVFGLFPIAAAPPAAPSGLTATTVSATQINLAWSDNSNNETGFKIEQSTDNVSFTQVNIAAANSTTLAATGLAPLTAYYFRVRATNSAGDSGYTNTASATTLTNQANVGLVGWWKLDDGSGITVTDSSGNGDSGTIAGEVTWIAGHVGPGALNFHNGGAATARVVVPDAARLRFTAAQSFTLATWVNPANTTGQWSAIIAKSRDLSPYYGLWVNPANNWVFKGSTSDVVGPAVSYAWHHLAAVQDGTAGTRTLYLDGLAVATGAAQAADGAGGLWFAQANSVSESFGGQLDDVRIYNRALSNAEVATLTNLTWTDADIGNVGFAGSDTIFNGTYSLNGSGADIWNNADAFNFAYQQVSGDFSITARVVSVQATDGWAKAGVMIRQSLAAGSVFTDEIVSSGNGVNFQYRPVADLGCNYTQSGGLIAPYWVRLVRTGGTLTGYQSANGYAWVPTGSTSLAMSDPVYAGLAVTAHNNGLICTGTFDNVALNFPGSLAFGVPAYAVLEAAGSAAITVARTGGTLGAVGVSYATAAGGTAVIGTDYTASSGTLSWADGDAAVKSFSVAVLDDNLAGSTKTVNLALSAPTGSASLGTQSAAVLSILDKPILAWRYTHFAANANNLAIAGDTVDFNHDGLINLQEYALAADPNQFVFGTRPTTVRVGSHLTLNFHRNTSSTDVTYVVEASSNLGGWSPVISYTAAAGWVATAAGATAAETAPSGTTPDQFVTVTVTDPADLTIGPVLKHFLRLRVTR